MQPINNIINPVSSSNRIAKHGKITNYPFTLGKGKPFSIFVKDADNKVVVITAKLYQDTTATELPICTNDWNPILIDTIESAVGLVDVYWGATLTN